MSYSLSRDLHFTIFFVIQSDAIIDYGWEYVAPEYATYAALSFWLLLAEGGRRSGGLAVLFVVAIISLYPLYVASMPEIISGVPSTIWETANFHMYSEESYLGIPMRALGLLVSWVYAIWSSFDLYRRWRIFLLTWHLH